MAELNVIRVLGLAGPNVIGALNRVGSKIGKTTDIRVEKVFIERRALWHTSKRYLNVVRKSL